MHHRDIPASQIHTPFNWIVESSTERESLSPSAREEYKQLLQKDDNTVWVWTPNGWKQIGGAMTPDEYDHAQSTPSSSWLVQHNLKRYPAVTVTDSAGNVVRGQIKYIDDMSVRMSFTKPFSGLAHFS